MTADTSLTPLQAHNLGRQYLRQANRFRLTSDYTKRNLEAAKEQFDYAREKEQEHHNSV